MFSGIVENIGRQQPFTVWYNDHVIKFCETREEADVVLARETKKEGFKVWKSNIKESERDWLLTLR